MANLTLVIGNKKYSSWSLRPWLLLRHIGVPFEEVRISLYQPGSRDRILRYSPAGKVPVLIDGSTAVWDSLAICEYLAERFPQAAVWPRDPAVRAQARSIAAEMHSGFMALRHELPMNCQWPRTGVTPSAAALADIERVSAIWRECRERNGGGGPWLFGSFTAADAMYAPVVLRLTAYGVAVTGSVAAYIEAALDDPALQEWIAAGRAESEVIAEDEAGTLVT